MTRSWLCRNSIPGFTEGATYDEDDQGHLLDDEGYIRYNLKHDKIGTYFTEVNMSIDKELYGDDFMAPRINVENPVDPKVANNPKAPLGMAKIPLGLVPPAATAHLADALRNGADKYGAWNFREVTISSSVYIHACKRHLELWWAGQEKASDSDVHHLGHAMACLALILDSQFQGNLDDDRPRNNLDTDALEALFKTMEH